MSKNTNVTFSFFSKYFNRTETKNYFINTNCFGDDLASWLKDALQGTGAKVEQDGPDQEDFGWYVNFEVSGTSYSCVVLFQENTDRWVCTLEYNAGLVGSLFGKRKKPVPGAVSQLFDNIFQSKPEIFEKVEWSNRIIA
jgi:hypothetical protein